VLLSTLSWYFECVAFWVVVRGFPGAAVGMQAGTFIYASMTVAGALSFLPGVWVLPRPACSPARTAGYGNRPQRGRSRHLRHALCTLWYAVIVGLVALFIFARRTHIRIQLPEKTTDAASAHLFQSSAHRHLNMGTLGGFPFLPRWCAAGKAGGLPTRPSHTSDFFGPSLKFWGRVPS